MKKEKIETENKKSISTQIAIIGGGLAGLACSIRLAKAGLEVILIEKNTYPFHRVCGEYISNEALDYVKSLGINPFDFGAVSLDKFWLSSPSGNKLELDLPLGGFGISRYTLDYELSKIAKKEGVEIWDGIFVKDVLNTNKLNDTNKKNESKFLIETSNGTIGSQIVIGSYGKRSNLDNKLQRDFSSKNFPYIGVKYHLKTDLMPNNVIALHNFWRGYCGISRIEDDKFCFCYLSHKDNLTDFKKVENIEKQLFTDNPFLSKILKEAEFLYEKPEIINQISFSPKKLIEDDILMCGDSAGMITPLCGNGMAMALHSSKILSDLLINHFDNQISFKSLKKEYQKRWNHQFQLRLKAGRTVQHFFGGRKSSEFLINTFKHVPSVARKVVSLTHGKSF
ncbi:flavin-dependent dehydrogenase [Bernardetia litoralis DSM 6794]|uniref:Flavin-dependent dehydrogenase n=1 Tax=Bernardetia litoralis (strain ATCC 23117 / DSM 6794 / NBRC 15988 / NCIMB 1366 / Fx l1 / Sio-4) TaxID=880071 RepID=I4AQW2_BERLS|nr:NAD(P)/FAD-dependent oxidoreductase [Bernardetia litoralis]AFM06347.1 flavin-dependent dehydrogenase [Bernardetia litoralis DSM 6794]